MKTPQQSASVRSAYFTKHLMHLFFPQLCLICEKETLLNKHSICSFCKNDLADLHIIPDTKNNIAAEIFWGRIKLDYAFSLLSYSKGNSTKTLLNRIKYRDKPELAVYMGELIGDKLIETEFAKSIDALLPVPIHPKKAFIRGYNQSERIAIGISNRIAVPVIEKGIVKSLHTQSQTKKGRFGRWDNLAGAFSANEDLKGYKHVALVDDVITTGATLERIASGLMMNNSDLRISVISLALAQ
jgi:ComF family protein